MTHDPVEPEFAERFAVLGEFLDEQFNGPPGSPRRVGFVLLAFNQHDGPTDRTNYLANVDLRRVIAMLQNFLPHAEARLAADRRAKRGREN